MKAKLDSWAPDGGPLHPINIIDHRGNFVQTRGASVMDYLAAHAPTEIPDWFELEAAEPRPRILGARECLHQVGFNGSQSDLDYLAEWIRDGTYELSVDSEYLRTVADAAAALFTGSREKVKAWDDAYALERYFAWRWYYAQMMLRHRPPTAE